MFDFLCVWREWVVFYVPFFKYGIIQFGQKTDLAPVDKTLYFAVWWRLHKWAKHSLAWCSTNKHEFALTIISGFWLTIKKSSDLTHPGMECTTTAHTITSKTLGETDPIMHHSINQWGYLSYENDIFLQMFFLIIFSYNVSLLRVGIKDRFTTCQIINIMYLRLNPFAKSNHWHLVCSWRRKWRYVWYMKYFVSVCRQIFVISSCSSISFWTWLLVGPGVSSVKDSMMFPSPGVTTPLTQWETSGNTEENGWKPGMGMTLLC